jgi:peroxiredoxin (alkyl hydroperoxide reductase subunit C)
MIDIHNSSHFPPNTIHNKTSTLQQESTPPRIPSRELSLDFEPIFTLPLIGEPAPPFRARTTQGPINFPSDYKGKWVLFFSYPGDFCATCTTEMLALIENKSLYDELGVEIVALSIDSLLSHYAWLKSIYDLDYNGYKNTVIDFPVIADTSMEISRKYGLLRRGETETETVRGGFLIDPKGIIRTVQIYPREVGASGSEIRRVVEAMMKFDKENVYMPANWQPGDDVLLPQPNNFSDIMKREDYRTKDGSIYCPNWYMCFKKDTETPQTNASSKHNGTNYSNILMDRYPKKPF